MKQTTKVKTKSPILEAVQQTASDLHRLGFVGKRNAGKSDEINLQTMNLDEGYRAMARDAAYEADAGEWINGLSRSEAIADQIVTADKLQLKSKQGEL